MYTKNLDFLKNNLLWSEGLQLRAFWVFQAILVGIVMVIFPRPCIALVMISGIQLLFLLFFYRNPERKTVRKEYQIFCPSDGKVFAIEPYFEGPFERRVCIFLSPLDVHVQWIPMAGIIEQIRYKSGKFSPAFLKKSDLNESNELIIKGSFGSIAVRQIAGILARRISCWVSPHDVVRSGQKYGMIHFSSRLDILLPAGVEVTLQVGQQVRGGLTQLGVWQCTESKDIAD